MKKTAPQHLAVGLFLALISSGSTFAAVIFTSGTNGQLNVPAVDSGADSYVLDGGGIFVGPFSAVFNSGLTITGDNGNTDVVTVDNDNHSIINNGVLNGGNDGDGIRVNKDITNSGGITNNDGAKIIGKRGINDDGKQEVHVTNLGEITGLDGDGIRVGDDSVITNGNVLGTDTGKIEGKDGGAGIRGEDNLTVTNNSGSVILGDDDGIDTGDDASIINSSGSSITGGNRGINAEGSDGLTVFNRGSITGNGEDGIDSDDFASITNYASGIITGTGDDGIDVENNSIVDNYGSITGTGDDGIDIDDDGIVNNYSSGIITGGSGDGIEAKDDLAVNNSGSITGSDDGITLNSGTITNNFGGIISGGSGGGDAGVEGSGPGTVDVNNNFGGLITGFTGVKLSGDSADLVENSGTITGTGGTAIKMGSGDDTTNINNGSTINGDVDGGDDVDTVNFSGNNTTDGDVFGYEEANKTGGGFSLVEGSLESDEVNVKDGLLTLTEGLDATTTAVGGFGDPAELGGAGTFTSDSFAIDSRGVISPGLRPLSIDFSKSIGTMTLAGDTVFSSNSTYRVDFNPWSGSHDQIDVLGDLDLNGGSRLAVGPTNVDAPIQDDRYLVIDQTAAVDGDETSGNFTDHFFVLENDVINDQADSPYWVASPGTFYSSAVSLGSFVSEEDVYLTVHHDYTNIPGLSESGHAFAGYLNNILSEAPDHSTLADFLGFIDYSDDYLTADVLNSYNPTLHVSAGDTLLHTGHSLNRLIENHLAGLRNRAAPVAPAPQPQYDAKGGMLPSDKSGYAAPVYGHKWTAWATGSYESLNYERGSGLGDLDGDTAAATFGIDYQVNDSFYLGVVGQLGRTDYDEGRYTELDIDSSYFGLYGTYDNANGYYLDFLLAYSDHDIDTQRYVYPGSTSASYGADGFTGMLGGGYMMSNQGVWSWGPVASVEYQSLDIDSFSESGLLGLNANSRDVDSLRSLLGIKAEYTSGRFDWDGAVRWAHDFSGDDDRDITAGFGGIGGGFRTSAYDRAEDAVILNLGVSTNLTESFSVGLSYFGEISLDDNGVDSHGGALEARFSF